MQRSQAIVDKLNTLLMGELTSADLYVLQGKMYDDWGYHALRYRLLHDSEDEHQHAKKFEERILFL